MRAATLDSRGSQSLKTIAARGVRGRAIAKRVKPRASAIYSAGGHLAAISPNPGIGGATHTSRLFAFAQALGVLTLTTRTDEVGGGAGVIDPPRHLS